MQDILSEEGLEAQPLADRLGKMTKFLYSLFYEISQNPSLVIKGERHEPAGI